MSFPVKLNNLQTVQELTDDPKHGFIYNYRTEVSHPFISAI